jgi:hypothetical protein
MEPDEIALTVCVLLFLFMFALGFVVEKFGKTYIQSELFVKVASIVLVVAWLVSCVVYLVLKMG